MPFTLWLDDQKVVRTQIRHEKLTIYPPKFSIMTIMKPVIHFFACTLLGLLILNFTQAQDPQWDDTSRPDWPQQFLDVEIPSTVDGKIQPAYFYATSQDTPQPLIVSLHTWSNNYQQRDPLIQEILARDYNYIRPDFRGPNNTIEACGSPLVTSDIDDAIAYALENANVDIHNIHVIGVSGGGHATLIAYMQSKHNIRTFSAWVPITDLSKWYYESLGRQTPYASHIALATAGNEKYPDVQEAKKRSPIFMDTPVELRENSRLYLYAGIHDGYNGSVPITHSLEMCNKIIRDFKPMASTELISQDIINQLVVTRYMPGDGKQTISDRKIHYANQFEDKIQIVIFDGGHEMLTEVALNHVPAETVLVIGDSNGAKKGGWVDQLQVLLFNDTFFNTSISGNTIGFDNSGSESRNSLKNITNHLTRYDPEGNRINKVLIMLGTNDCKNEFDRKLREVPGLYNQLLDSIKLYYENRSVPEIVMISPPPYGHDSILQEKYHGGARRVQQLNKDFAKVAAKADVAYIDVQSALWPVYDELTRDGVHFNEQGYKLVAFLIHRALLPE